MHKLPTGDDLRIRAEQLGVVCTIDDPTESQRDYKMLRGAVSDAELQRRVVQAEQHLLAKRAWMLALFSAIASAISAAAAWAAVVAK